MLSLVKSDKKIREKVKKALCLNSLRNGNWVLILQLKLKELE